MNSVSLRNPRPRQLKLRQQGQVSGRSRSSAKPSGSKKSDAPQAQCGGGVCETAWRPSQQVRGASSSSNS